MPIDPYKQALLLPAPRLSVAHDDTVHLEDVVAGAYVEIEAQRGIPLGVPVILHYNDGNTLKQLSMGWRQGRTCFHIPGHAFIKNLYGGMQLHYRVESLCLKSEVLDLRVSFRL